MENAKLVLEEARFSVWRKRERKENKVRAKCMQMRAYVRIKKFTLVKYKNNTTVGAGVVLLLLAHAPTGYKRKEDPQGGKSYAETVGRI